MSSPLTAVVRGKREKSRSRSRSPVNRSNKHHRKDGKHSSVVWFIKSIKFLQIADIRHHPVTMSGSQQRRQLQRFPWASVAKIKLFSLPKESKSNSRHNLNQHLSSRRPKSLTSLMPTRRTKRRCHQRRRCAWRTLEKTRRHRAGLTHLERLNKVKLLN